MRLALPTNNKIKRFKGRREDSVRTYFNANWAMFASANAPIRISSKKLIRLILILKRGSRKREDGKRKFWFFTFPTTPLTKKSQNSRMGKGRGKFKFWFSRVRASTPLFSFSGFRNGRARFLTYQIQKRLTPHLTFIDKSRERGYLD